MVADRINLPTDSNREWRLELPIVEGQNINLVIGGTDSNGISVERAVTINQVADS